MNRAERTVRPLWSMIFLIIAQIHIACRISSRLGTGCNQSSFHRRRMGGSQPRRLRQMAGDPTILAQPGRRIPYTARQRHDGSLRGRELLVLRPARQRDAAPPRISELDAARFVAFCEGRLRLKFADWFERFLSKGIIGYDERSVANLQYAQARQLTKELTVDLVRYRRTLH